jgi:hypothetical protein
MAASFNLGNSKKQSSAASPDRPHIVWADTDDIVLDGILPVDVSDRSAEFRTVHSMVTFDASRPQSRIATMEQLPTTDERHVVPTLDHGDRRAECGMIVTN